jgi:hypothetical protein
MAAGKPVESESPRTLASAKYLVKHMKFNRKTRKE